MQGQGQEGGLCWVRVRREGCAESGSGGRSVLGQVQEGDLWLCWVRVRREGCAESGSGQEGEVAPGGYYFPM